ncbi:hypothetical protein FRC08_000921, partial [Ceratobasidium sp. 394]
MSSQATNFTFNAIAPTQVNRFVTPTQPLTGKSPGSVISVTRNSDATGAPIPVNYVVHPEGPLIYWDASLVSCQPITDTHLSLCAQIIGRGGDSIARAKVTVFVEVRDHSRADYYIIMHESKTVAWIDYQLPESFADATPAKHNHEYWIHMENFSGLLFPSHEDRQNLVNVLASLAVDASTSDGSTSPMSVEHIDRTSKQLPTLNCPESWRKVILICRLVAARIKAWCRRLRYRHTPAAPVKWCTSCLPHSSSPGSWAPSILTDDPRIWEGPPSQTNRYDDIFAGPGSYRTILPGPASFLAEMDEDAQPHVDRTVTVEAEQRLARSTSRPYRSGTVTPIRVTMIKSSMQVDEVIRCLVEHGCQDITGELDPSSISSDPIASGGSSNIYLCKLRDGTEVAVKYLFNLRSLDASNKSFKLLKHTACEIYAWSKCHHPGILPLLGMARFRGQVAVVTQWMENGTLSSFLCKHPSVDRVQLCVQLAEALEYMHTRRIVHGDIKAANILMSKDNTPLFADFGNALLTHGATLEFTATTSLGITPQYTAPEILKGDSRYSTEADIYAFGMLIF